MQQSIDWGAELVPVDIVRWQAYSTNINEPFSGSLRTRSPIAALITLACELLHGERYGLPRCTWKVRLWHHGKWHQAERTIRILAPNKTYPRRAWIPGVGVYGEDGAPIREGRQL